MKRISRNHLIHFSAVEIESGETIKEETEKGFYSLNQAIDTFTNGLPPGKYKIKLTNLNNQETREANLTQKN